MSLESRRFPHHHLLAYERIVEFHRFVVALRRSLRTGMADLHDQLLRASTSACLNLAEGASAWEPGNKRRYFRSALASMGECAAALELAAIGMGGEIEGVEQAMDGLSRARSLTSGLLRKFQ